MDTSAPELVNWDGSVVQHPTTIVYPRSVEEIVAIMKDAKRYPSPIRAIGSNHSTTFCTVADNGTAVCMQQHFNRIIAIRDDTVTVEAGALYIDVAGSDFPDTTGQAHARRDHHLHVRGV
jgi:FAD/FMN-containing dehydrogenase